MKINFSVLPHQRKLLEDTTTRYLSLVAGFGAGKTYSFCLKTIHLAMLNTGYRGVVLEPTHAMVQDTLIPSFDEVLDTYKIPYKFRASPYPQYTLKFAGGETEVLFRSGENYRRLAGLNLAFFGVDEIDTINKNIAVPMWRLLQSRLRSGNVYQGFCTSTPEGFNFLYDFFILQDKKVGDRRIIKAKTTDNPFLPPEFVEDLMNQYPSNLIEAYINGEFVNLTGNTVYYSFDRKHNSTQKSIKDYQSKNDKPVLHIGIDFNIGKMSAVTHIIENDEVFAVDEFMGAMDTPHLINAIKERYQGFKVYAYPDPAGNQRRTSAGGGTDITLLKNAGFAVFNHASHPPVRSRVNSMNQMFCNANGLRRYLVNTSTCPTYTQTLEQQVYNSLGEPDKSDDKDHPNDASGYFIQYKYPIRSSNGHSFELNGI